MLKKSGAMFPASLPLGAVRGAAPLRYLLSALPLWLVLLFVFFTVQAMASQGWHCEGRVRVTAFAFIIDYERVYKRVL